MINTDFFKQFSDMSKDSLRPWIKLNGIASKSIERFTKQQMGITSEILGLQMRQLQDLANVKKADEMIEIISQNTKEVTSRATDFTMQAMENFQNASLEVSKWYEECFSSATEELQKAGKNVAKTAQS